MGIIDVKALLEKYKAGTCTPEELRVLEEWYESWRHPDAKPVEWRPDEELAQELLQDFREMRRSREALFRGGTAGAWWKAAAVAIPLIGIGALLWTSRPSVNAPASGPVLAVVPQEPDSKRFILLPDSSTVVLREGSTLIYPDVFKDNAREVTLTGEGYFDIKEQPGKPFRIRSGKLITTVLGTSFNIKAYPGQPSVTVTVTTGKVKIEEGGSNKLLGILLPDQQIVYENETAATKPVKAAETVAWVKKGMDFNNIPFEEIARRIGEQYQVKIGFANDALRKCRIRATFEGTETLDKILYILCTVGNATYTVRDNEVTINGDGCMTE